ncbi:MAG TPA: hypothetical protein VHY22_09365 [Chthoniobacteraceae bacterium]|nr:hypothetical protein [Chthoniobacteraceae bacterium]
MNRRRHTNTVPVAGLVRWVVVAFFLGAAGLSYVYFKNQMQTTGNEISALENQLNSLKTQDESVRAQIARLSSHGYLERRLAEGFIKLTPITDDHIVRVHAPVARTADNDADDDLRPVSNRLIAQ